MNIEDALTTASAGARVSSTTAYGSSIGLIMADTLDWINEYAAALGFLVALLTFALTWYYKAKEHEAKRLKDRLELEMNIEIAKQRAAALHERTNPPGRRRNDDFEPVTRHYGPPRRFEDDI